MAKFILKFLLGVFCACMMSICEHLCVSIGMQMPWHVEVRGTPDPCPPPRLRQAYLLFTTAYAGLSGLGDSKNSLSPHLTVGVLRLPACATIPGFI